MISQAVIRKIRQIQIKTNKILSGKLLGVGSSLYKGSGFDFDQVREYVQGDDLRFIDWKSSARSDKLLTKQYFEERNQRIVIVLDISKSVFCGSNMGAKYDYLAQAAAVFILLAQARKDQVGLVLFDGRINQQWPIKAGRQHSLSLLQAVFKEQAQPQNLHQSTNLQAVLEKLIKDLKQKSLVVLISDFIDELSDYGSVLKQLSHRHSVVAVRYLDQYEKAWPNIGLLPIVDPETGVFGMINTRFAKNQKSMLNLALANRIKQQDLILCNSGVSLLKIKHETDLILEIVNFFCNKLK